MAHSGRAAGGPPLPPQRRSLQQRFGPHAKARNGRGTVRRLLALYARWKRELILVVGLTVLSTAASLAVPYLLGLAVDCFRVGGVDRTALAALLVLLVGSDSGTVAWQLGTPPLDGDYLPENGDPNPPGLLCQIGEASPVLL